MIEEFRGNLLSGFDGLPVFDFRSDWAVSPKPVALPRDVEGRAWRIAVRMLDDTSFPEAFAGFVERVEVERIRALIIGPWFLDTAPGEEPPDEAFAAIAEHAERFGQLESLFFADFDGSAFEISWVAMSDPAPLLAALPRLRRFALRGTTDLSSMEPFAHEALEELTFQGGGLPPQVARAIAASRLPALTGLDLYLGTSEYGGGATPADLEPILSGRAFPRLRHLGLRNAENADEIAAALAHAPVVAQLESLDLSLGALTDEGAVALLNGQPLTHLKSLDLHHHYLSEEMTQRVRADLRGVAVDTQERLEAESMDFDGETVVWRYIAVSE
jgi:hypothetical protein